jgi:hypothetical protein
MAAPRLNSIGLAPQAGGSRDPGSRPAGNHHFIFRNSIAATASGVPMFVRAGNLFCVDIAHGRIFRNGPTGEVRVVTEHDAA